MIYDLGCLDQPVLWKKIALSLPGAAASLALIAGLASIGQILSGTRGFRAADIFAGWGYVAAFMTATAILLPNSLPLAAVGIFTLMGFAAARGLKRKLFTSPFWLFAIFPGALLLIAINVAGVAKWDDFAIWVPNALYLFRNDALPATSLPQPHSIMPGYPYALPILTYLASKLANGFIVQGGAMINFLLLAAFAAFLAETRAVAATAVKPSEALMRLAAAIFAVTILNPGFNASFSVTSQGDTPTSILTAVIAFLLVETSERLREREAIPIATLVQLAGAMLAFVLIKQSNLVLLLLLGVGFAAISLPTIGRTMTRRPTTGRATLWRVCLAFVPALAVRLLWQHYVAAEIGGNGFAFQPLGAWRFDLVLPLLEAMADEMLKKSGLTILLLGLTFFGLRSIFLPPTFPRRLAIVGMVTALGYLGFLTAAYLGSNFGETEIRRAASFYRYSTHLALLAVALIWVTYPQWKSQIRLERPALYLNNPAGAAVAAAFGICLLPAVLLLHAEWLIPRPDLQICEKRAFADHLIGRLPDHTSLVVLEPETDGLLTYVINLQFDLEGPRTGKDFGVDWYIERTHYHFDRDQMPAYLARIEHDPKANAVLIPQADKDPLSFWGSTNREGPLLFEKHGTGWKRLDFSPGLL